MRLRFYLSGGEDNEDPTKALGGPRSVHPLGSGLNNLFPDTTSAEAAAGGVRHRCVYMVNEDSVVLVEPIRAWLVTLPDEGQEIALAVGDRAVAAAIDSEERVPENLTGDFITPISKIGGVICPRLAPGEQMALWVRRKVSAGTPTMMTMRCAIRVEGDTMPSAG